MQVTDVEGAVGRVTSSQFSPLGIFLIKVCAVTVAAIVFVYFSLAILVSTAEDKFAAMGGSAFWVSVESKLEKLASQPDLPPEKKQKIVDTLRRLSQKYRPYIDALKD
ncbi:hypothetical protein [Bradyrhizobium sp. USDA 223]